MPEPDDDIVVIEEELEPITREQGEEYPELLADPASAAEGVLDYEDPERFAALELEAIEDLLGEDEPGGAGGATDGTSDAPAPISPHQRRALRLALTQKGLKETPPGSNKNIYSTYFGFGAQEWCADFVAWALDRTGNQDKVVPWGYPSAVKNILVWGRENGKVRRRPRKGDIFVKKPSKHTGFVISAVGTSFLTIEGNTSGPDGVVYVATHQRDSAEEGYYFIRHHW